MVATTLRAGEIAFTAFQSDTTGGLGGKGFQFVLLRSVKAGTAIYFTDGGYRTNSSSFDTDETMLRFIAPTDMAAGSKVTFSGSPVSGSTWSGINPVTGAVLPNASIDLNTAGDQITALINPVFGGANALTGTAIAQINFSAGGFLGSNTAGNDTDTALAPGLLAGDATNSTAVNFGDVDNGIYNGAAAGAVNSGLVRTIANSINGAARWQTAADPIGGNMTAANFTVAEPNLAVGDVAVAGYNTGNTLADKTTVDSLQIVALKPISAGTVIFITDRAWSGTAFAAAGGGDGTITHTFASNVAAGSIVTIPLSGGVDLDQAGDALYIYQGNSADVPTSFLFALELGDGNSTFNGTLTNTGLTDGNGAVSVRYDSGVYNGPTTEAYSHLYNQESLFLNMSDSTNWNGDDHGGQNALDQTDHSGPYNVAADVTLWMAALSGGDGLVSVGVDPSVGSGNSGYNLTVRYTLDNGDLTDTLVAPRDIAFDTVEGKFFILDSNSSGGTNRILQGNISDLHGNPQAPVPVTVLYTSNQTGTALSNGEAQMRDMQVDVANNIIYFTHGQRLEKIGFNTPGQASTVLANFNSGNPNGNSGNNFMDDFVVNFATGTAYLTSHRIISGQEGDTVTKNYIYKVSNLSGSATFANGQISVLPFSPDDQASVPFAGAGAPGEAFPQEEGTLEGIALSPDGNTLIFSTAKVLYDHDGDSGVAGGSGTPPQLIQGGIFTYSLLPANSAGNYTQIFGQTDDGDTNSQTITAAGPQGLLDDVEVDPVTGHIYFLDQTGDQLIIGGISQNPPGDEGVWRINANGTGLVFVQAIHNINGLGVNSIHINRAPILAGNGLAAAITESSSALNSGETNKPLLFGSVSISDADTTDGTDEIAHAVVRISNFHTGDLLRISNNTNGTTASGITYNYNASTGAMTLTGAATTSEYAAAIALVTYSYTGDNPTNYGTQPTRTIFASVGDGLNHSDEISVTVNVTGINDTPNSVAGNGLTISEDSTNTVLLGTTGADATRIKISDVDADPATQDLLVTFGVNFGTLTLDTTIVGGIAAANITAQTADVITVLATQNQINTTLAASGLKYTPAANFNGADTLVITTNDRGLNGNDPGGSGTGTTEENQVTKTITVSAVNDAPTVGGDGTEAAATILEDTPSVAGQLISALFGPQFSDALDQQQALENPTGSTANTLAGIAIVANGSSAATGHWQYFNGTTFVNIGAATTAQAVMLTAGTAIRFAPAQDYFGAAPTLTAHLIDSSGIGFSNLSTTNLSAVGATGGTTRFSSGTVVLSQDITPVNDAPVIAHFTDIQSHFEGDPARLIDIVPTAALVTDVDSANFDGGSLTVTISGGDSAEDVLGVLDGNLITSDAIAVGGKVRYNNVEIGTYSSDGKNGAPLTIDFGTASKTAVQALIGRLTYLNTDNDDPTVGGRSIDVVLNDGDGNANGGDPTGSATAVINMQAINDVTVVGGDTTVRAFEEGVNGAADHILVNNTVTLVDVDDDTLTNVKISITGNYVSTEDRLGFVNDNAATFGDIVGSFDVPTGVITLTSPGGAATLAQFEAAIRAATYDNLSEEPSTATRTVRIVADDPPAGVSNSFQFDISVMRNNDSPSGTSDTEVINEDTVVEIKEGLLGFGDADGDAFAGVRITEAPTGGKIYYDNGSGPVEVTTFPTSTYFKVDLDAGKLTFVPTEHLAGPGTASFKFVVVDDGGTAGTGNNTDPTPRTLTFDITPVNDEPEGSDTNSATVADDQIHTFTVANFQDGLQDVEGDQLSAVQLVALPSSSDGIIYYDPDGAAPAAAVSANDIFTIDDLINNRLTFDPAATGSAKAVTLTFKAIDDGSPAAATDQTPNTFTLNVTPGNQAPVLDLNGTAAAGDDSAASVTEQAGTAVLAADLEISDNDDTELTGALVSITSGFQTTDELSVGGVANDTSGPIDWSYDAVNGVLTFTGTASVADYQALLRQVVIAVNGNAPGASRTVTWTVDDGVSDSAPQETAVTVTATPDAPTGLNDTLPVTEDSFRNLGTGNFSFLDPDGDDFESVTISNVTGGKLYIDANGGDHSDAVEAASTVTLGLLDFAGGDKVFFRPDADSNANGSLTFTLKDDSGAAGADTSGSYTLTFTITPVNDHPNLQLSSTGPSATLEYVENDGEQAIAPTAVLTDIDSNDFNGGSLLVSLGATGKPGDALGILEVGGITVAGGKVSYNGTEIGEVTSTGAGGSDLSVTFGAGATREAVDKLIEAVSYTNSSDNPSTAQRTVTYTVNDGDGGDATGSAAAVIHFTNANDAPQLTVPPAQSGSEDVPLVFSSANSNAITISDVDIGSGVASVVLNVSNGTLALGPNVAGLAVPPVGDNSDTVTLIGTLTGINDALEGLTYTGPLHANGVRTLTVSVSDNGFSGPNLIVNPGAEIGAAASDYGSSVVPAGWTLVGGTGTFTALQYDIPGQSSDDLDELDSAAVGGGNAYFAGGPTTPVATAISQLIDVSGDAAQIDAGNMLANLSGVFGGYLAVADSMTMTVNFLSATSDVLGSASIGGVTPGDRGNQTLLIPSIGVVSVPPLTRSIEVVLTAADSGDGAYGNGYADNLSLVLSERITKTVSIDLAPVDDQANAQPDTPTTNENTPQIIDVRSNDTDVDSPVAQVTTVAGMSISTGQTVDLPSGAKVTLNADGTLTYDPNGKFITLNDGSGGAVNTSKDDVFSYGLSDGSTSTVTMTVTGVAGPGDWLEGNGGNNTIAGTPQPDLFMLHQGGNDTVYGLAENDGFVFGGALTSQDAVDGGSGNDQVVLQGNYANTPLTLGTGFINVESIALLRGNNNIFGAGGTDFFDYNITTVTQNVAPGQLLTIDAAQLRAGEDFTFNGAAETDGGSFRLFGGFGVENLTGGSSADLFQFSPGRFGASDRVNGGAPGGRDELALRGDYTLTFGAAQLTSIEVLSLLSGRDTAANTDYDYNITMVDANVVDGTQFIVDAGQLKAGESLTFNGAAENDATPANNGTFRIFGGKGSDSIIGGGGADLITGGLGNDSMYGGGGNDTFIFRSTDDSNNSLGRDAIQDFALGDLIDLSKIDADSSTLANDAFDYIGSSNFSNTAGELRVADQGGGIWLVQGDTDGVGGSDFEFFMVLTNTPAPAETDFFL